MSFKSTSKVFLAVVTLALLFVVMRAIASHYKAGEPRALSRAELEQAARAEVTRNQEAGRRAKEDSPRAEADAAKSQANPFETDTGRALMLGLFIKPVLKEMLNDPDSLQDLEISSVRRLKGAPTTFRVVVSYRARNAFGGLVGAQQVFACVENPDASNQALNAWIILPVKK